MTGTDAAKQKSFNTEEEARAFVAGLVEADDEIMWAMSMKDGQWHISWTR